MASSSSSPSSSFDTLQERLTTLQETTAQLKELIERLSSIKFQPGSVPLSASISSTPGEDDLESNPAAELSAEINQTLREEEDELELLREEIADLPSRAPGTETEHRRLRLREGAQRLRQELKA